jgi:fatty-acyl-CoA synthase
MFHANAWGLPYIAWVGGADIIQPERFLQPEPLIAMIEELRPTFAAAVPTVWTGVLRAAAHGKPDFSSLREVVVGGAAVPRQMIQEFRDTYGVTITQGWGMTETSPLAATSVPPFGVPEGGDEELDWRARTGRIICGVDLRITEPDGTELPWDGKAIGEIEVRGPWITGEYASSDEADDKFRPDGWLRTGDMATVEPNGFTQIVDRTKDVIKSGGEWISSVALEGALMGHDDVAEAAVISMPDERWGERPLAVVVPRGDARPDEAELIAMLAELFPKWWLPDRIVYRDEIPKTSAGKFRKTALREEYTRGE